MDRLEELPERIRNKIWIYPKTGCWLWTGATTNKGYPQIRVNRVTKYAHIVVYELLVGPVPDTLELDHKCFITFCVRWDHLEPVTRSINVQRSWDRYKKPNQCMRGHEYTERNLYVTKTGKKQCRICNNANQRNYMKKKRAITRGII